MAALRADVRRLTGQQIVYCREQRSLVRMFVSAIYFSHFKRGTTDCTQGLPRNSKNAIESETLCILLLYGVPEGQMTRGSYKPIGRPEWRMVPSFVPPTYRQITGTSGVRTICWRSHPPKSGRPTSSIMDGSYHCMYGIVIDYCRLEVSVTGLRGINNGLVTPCQAGD